MPIYHQGRKVKEVYHQGRKVKEIWHMGRLIYTSRPVEVMPPTPGYSDARNWLRATLQKYGLDYTTVTELPFDIDSRNATRMAYMFQDCSSLTSVPELDTSRVTEMYYMFRGCSSLTSVPEMDTGQVTNMCYMFNQCSSLTTVPTLNTGNVTNFDYMFQYCRSLADGNVTLTVKRKGATTTSMIFGSGLTREPFLTIE